MKRFDILKTIQLVLLIVLTVIALTVILRNPVLYGLIASDADVRRLCTVLWLVLVISFAFLFYDFNSYAGLKRENTELDHAVYSDALTGVANRYSVDTYIGEYLNKPLPEEMGCITLELTNLGRINALLGHTGGDAAIQLFSEILLEASGGICFVGRNGGNKFVAIFRECSDKRIERFLSEVRRLTDEKNKSRGDATIRYSTGVAFREGESVKTLTELVALSDRRAWKAAEEAGKGAVPDSEKNQGKESGRFGNA